jgi:hypothetical protein
MEEFYTTDGFLSRSKPASGRPPGGRISGQVVQCKHRDIVRLGGLASKRPDLAEYFLQEAF